MRRGALLLLLLAVALSASLWGALHWLLHTRQGFDWTLARLAALQKVQIGVQDASGLLGEQWQIARMTIRAERVDMTLPVDVAPQGALHPVIPAIANAIFNAVGVRVTKLPIHAEDVLALIKAKAAHNEPIPQRP